MITQDPGHSHLDDLDDLVTSENALTGLLWIALDLNVTIQPHFLNENFTAVLPSINNLHPALMEISGPPTGTSEVMVSHLEVQN